MSTIFHDILFLRTFYLISTLSDYWGKCHLAFLEVAGKTGCFPATSCAPKYVFTHNIGINSPLEIGHWSARQEGRQNLVSVLKILVVQGEFCSRKLSDILSYRLDILHSTCTISEHNLIRWFHWVHRWDRIPKGLWVQGAGLKLFIDPVNLLVHWVLCLT